MQIVLGMFLAIIIGVSSGSAGYFLAYNEIAMKPEVTAKSCTAATLESAGKTVSTLSSKTAKGWNDTKSYFSEKYDNFFRKDNELKSETKIQNGEKK